MSGVIDPNAPATPDVDARARLIAMGMDHIVIVRFEDGRRDADGNPIQPEELRVSVGKLLFGDEKPPTTPATRTMTVTRVLNLREQSSSGSRLLGQLQSGQTVQATTVTQNKYTQIASPAGWLLTDGLE